MRTNAPARAASVLLALEAVALGVVLFREFVALVQGDTASVASSLALLVMTLLAAVALVAFAVAVWRGQSWGRSGGTVAQELILAVAVGAATGTYGDPMSGLVLAIPAIIVLVLLVLAARRAARDAASKASE